MSAPEGARVPRVSGFLKGADFDSVLLLIFRPSNGGPFFLFERRGRPAAGRKAEHVFVGIVFIGLKAGAPTADFTLRVSGC